MKIRFYLILLLISFRIGGLSQNASDTLRILAIGNSFSVDGVEYFDDLAHSAGKKLVVGNAVIGGCSLEKHLQCTQTDAKAYHYYKSSLMTPSDKDSVTLLYCLLDESWDYITFQQASPLSGQAGSYFPYLKELASYVKSHSKNPQVKFVIHQTWAYSADSKYKAFQNYNRDQLLMYQRLVNAYREAARKMDIKTLIPSGTSVQNGRTSPLGDTFCRDGFHLSVLGRYTVACAWFETFFGEKANKNFFAPAELSPEQVRRAQEAAHAAIKKPDKITRM